jgi:hypothetical protein
MDKYEILRVDCRNDNIQFIRFIVDGNSKIRVDLVKLRETVTVGVFETIEDACEDFILNPLIDNDSYMKMIKAINLINGRDRDA